MALSSSHYLTANVPYVHLLPKYRPERDVSLPPEDDPKIPACCVLSEHMTNFSLGTQLHFGGFPLHPVEMEYTNGFKCPN
jgi:hypothetical protein